MENEGKRGPLEIQWWLLYFALLPGRDRKGWWEGEGLAWQVEMVTGDGAVGCNSGSPREGSFGVPKIHVLQISPAWSVL